MVGVPGYLLNRRLLVVGAQSTETLINAFDRAMFGEGDDAIASPLLH
jgi:predicted DsbA family dithiol-disulfide isomerase